MSNKNSGPWRVRALICALFVLGFAVLLVFASRFGTAWLQKRTETGQTAQSEASSGLVYGADGAAYRRKKYIKTYLLMGIDKSGPSQSATNINNQQTDFNALVVVDLKTESYTILYLNRDTMTEVPVLALDGTPYTKRTQQLALAHTYGTGMEDSCENTANTVSALLGGVSVDHYAAFYLGSIGTLNEAVGGVTVKVEDDLTASDPALYVGAEVTLDAAQAEHYVRSRMDVADGTNLNRMRRQMTYITAWTQQASAKMENDAGFAVTLAEQLSQSTVTDLTVQQVSDLAEAFNSYTQAESRELAGEAVQGEVYIEYYLDEDALQQTILDLFYEQA